MPGNRFHTFKLRPTLCTWRDFQLFSEIPSLPWAAFLLVLIPLYGLKTFLVTIHLSSLARFHKLLLLFHRLSLSFWHFKHLLTVCTEFIQPFYLVISSFLKLFILCFESFAPMYVCTPLVCAWCHGGEKRVLGLLGLEFQKVMSHCEDAGTWILVHCS